ncbi:MAG: SIS domain-containing protein [Candidatus Beckwithbacteria bacterium]|nr:SIS domain-containing protein [Candidatus Beckwithbacteria bacterium]
MTKIIIDQLQTASVVSAAMIKNCQAGILQAAQMIIKTFKQAGKVLLCGNGGSASQAQHIAAEMINKFRLDRSPLAAIALTTDTSNLTSISNDFGFSYVFSKQVEALGKKGDVLIIITTSDVSLNEANFHSRNLGLALESARKIGLKTIGLVSDKTKIALPLLDAAVKIPSSDTPRIQEGQLLALHIICDLVEQAIFPKINL